MTGALPRLLFITANETARWGASETTWIAAAKRLAGGSASVWASVKWWLPEAPEVTALEQHGCTVSRRAPDPILRQLHELPFGERESGILSLAKPTLAIVSQGDNWEGLGWLEECARRRVPYVVISNSASSNFWPSDDLAARLADGYAGARRAYFVSEANWRLTEQQIGRLLPDARITGTPYQVPHDVQLPWPATDGQVALACVGRLCPNSKGQDVLFQVLSQPRWRRRGLTVSLFGEGTHGRVLRTLAAMWELRNVSFRGHVSDVVEIWRNHHALVLPSREEGLPAVILEAALCGRPSLVTDVAGNTVHVHDGETGFVAESSTAPALDRCLERLWIARARLPELGARAQERARLAVSPDPVATLVADLGALAGLPECAAREPVGH